MGRHAAPAAPDAVTTGPLPRLSEWNGASPVTDPRLFDRPLPAAAQPAQAGAQPPVALQAAPQPRVAPQPRPAAAPVAPQQRSVPQAPRTVPPAAPTAGIAAARRVAQARELTHPRPVAPQLPPVAHMDARVPAQPHFTDRPISPTTPLAAAALTSRPRTPAARTPLATPPERLPRSLRPGRSASLAACAVAVLGVVSAAAMMLPESHSAADAKELASKSTRVLPAKAAPGNGHHRTAHQNRGLHRGWAHHQAAPTAAATPAPSASALVTALATPTQSPTATPTPSASALVTALATPSATQSPTATPSPIATPSSTPSATATPGSSTTPIASTSPTATASPRPTSTPSSPTVTPAPAGTYSLSKLVAGAAAGSTLGLGAGTYSFSNFSSYDTGVILPGGIAGAGEGRTVVQMTAHTSTKAGSVPTASGTTNQLSLLKTTGGSPVLRDFTLQGTPQGHLYNGLRLERATNARVENVKVAAIPGNSRVNPGETFGINDFHTTGSVYRGVEIDGAGVGASALAFNSSTGATVSDSYFHNNPYSAGVAVWQTSNVTMQDVITTNNRTGVNLERASGQINLVRPTFSGNTAQDIYVGSDQGSAKITITDPKFSGKLRIRIAQDYWAGTNLQKKSDIHVIIGGVDRTSSVVQWL